MRHRCSLVVFAHSILDVASLDYCYLGYMLRPNDWTNLIAKKLIKLGSIHDAQKIADASMLEYLRRRALSRRLKLIIERCAKDATVSIVGFTFDLDRIRAFEELRNQIIHHPDFETTSGGIGEMLHYLLHAHDYIATMFAASHELEVPGVTKPLC